MRRRRSALLMGFCGWPDSSSSTGEPFAFFLLVLLCFFAVLVGCCVDGGPSASASISVCCCFSVLCPDPGVSSANVGLTSTTASPPSPVPPSPSSRTMMVPSASSVVDCLNRSGRKSFGEGRGDGLMAARRSRRVRCWRTYPLRNRAAVQRKTRVVVSIWSVFKWCCLPSSALCHGTWQQIRGGKLHTNGGRNGNGYLPRGEEHSLVVIATLCDVRSGFAGYGFSCSTQLKNASEIPIRVGICNKQINPTSGSMTSPCPSLHKQGNVGWTGNYRLSLPHPCQEFRGSRLSGARHQK